MVNVVNSVNLFTGGCNSQGFLNNTISNYTNVMGSTGSTVTKTLTSLGLGGFVANTYGGLTAGGIAAALWKAKRSGFKIVSIGARTFMGAATTAAATWAINTVLIGGMYSAGVLVGSAIRSAVNSATSSACNKNSTCP